MKKIYIYLTLILTFVVMLNVMNLLADEPAVPDFVRKIITPAPCLDNLPPWQGPKWYKICTDTVFNLDNGLQPPDNWGTCCYYVKYYDRVEVGNSGTTRHYQTNVVGVFYDGEDCEKRSKEAIIQEFQKALYKKLCDEDENYFNKIVCIGGKYDWYEATADSYVYTTGGCYQKDAQGNTLRDEFNNPIPCDQNNYCCRETKTIKLERKNDKLYVTEFVPKSPPYFELFGTSCPTKTCKKGCNNVMMSDLVDINCGTECDEGGWELMNKNIPIPTCPSCIVFVEYYTRTNPPCPEYGNKEANDIKLSKIVVSGDLTGPCATCQLSAQQIHQAVFENLKNSEFRNLPEINGQCKEYYRFFQSSCWRDETVPGYYDYDYNSEPPLQIWVPPFRVIMKCAGDNCCKRVFRICKDSQGNILPPEQIGPSVPSDLNCGIIIEPCFFICD